MFTQALRPFMRAWSITADTLRLDVPRPEDAPLGQGAGPDPDRILILGTGAAVGWGVRTHELALTGQVARQLAVITGHGTDVLTLARPATSIETVGELLSGLRLDRYDAVVVIAGMPDAVTLLPMRRWRNGVAALLDQLSGDASPGPEIVMVGIQPVRSTSIYGAWPGLLAQHHASAMNAATEALCRTRPQVTFVPFPAPSAPPGTPGSRTPGIYQDWGQHLAQTLARVLPTGEARDRRRRARSGVDPEVTRQEALDAMRVLEAEGDARLHRITRVARDMLGTRYAAVNMIDRDRQWAKSQVGTEFGEIPRSSSICDRTIRREGVTVFRDLWEEETFRDNGMIRQGEGIRFYAGYPINSPDGYRVGTLCVLDPDARASSAIDEAALRALAHEVEKELWLEAHASVGDAVG